MQLSQVIRQKSYEKIVYVLHRHPVTFVPKVILFIILLVIPGVLYFMLTTLFPDIFVDPVARSAAILFGSAYYLGAIMFFYTVFTLFYLDISIVTNDRLVDIDQEGLFWRTSFELDLHHIQDITTDVHGFFPSIFHYGDVQIKTASSNVDIVMRNVAHPDKLREDLIRLADEDRKFHHVITQ